MKWGFHPEAEEELFDAIDYYQSLAPNLGESFAQEVYKTIQRILDFPMAWPEVRPTIRRCLLNRYPYSILYTIKNDQVVVLAVMNLYRKPEYWQQRTK
jgi:plasmid stabilization system protein ParE